MPRSVCENAGAKKRAEKAESRRRPKRPSEETRRRRWKQRHQIASTWRWSDPEKDGQTGATEEPKGASSSSSSPSLQVGSFFLAGEKELVYWCWLLVGWLVGKKEHHQIHRTSSSTDLNVVNNLGLKTLKKNLLSSKKKSPKKNPHFVI